MLYPPDPRAITGNNALGWGGGGGGGPPVTSSFGAGGRTPNRPLSPVAWKKRRGGFKNYGRYLNWWKGNQSQQGLGVWDPSMGYLGARASGGKPPGPPPAGGGAPLAAAANPWDAYLRSLNDQEARVMERILASQRGAFKDYAGSLAGFGQALGAMGREAWDRIGARTAASAGELQGLQEGFGDQYTAGLVAANDQIARDYAAIGQSGPLGTVDPEAAAEQVATVGNTNPGQTLGNVGKLWETYGATVPGNVGFMTEQNIFQASRDAMAAEEQTRNEFAKAMLDNPQQAVQMWQAVKAQQDIDRKYKEDVRRWGKDYAQKERELKMREAAAKALAGEEATAATAKGKQIDSAASKVTGVIMTKDGKVWINPATGQAQAYVPPAGDAAVPKINEQVSANRGFLTDTTGAFIKDANGKKIPYKRKPGKAGGSGPSGSTTPGKGPKPDETPAEVRAQAKVDFTGDVDDALNDLLFENAAGARVIRPGKYHHPGARGSLVAMLVNNLVPKYRAQFPGVSKEWWKGEIKRMVDLFYTTYGTQPKR